MPFQLLLPDIGEGVVEAEILRWLVAPGDVVEEDQPLVEVMTDKATVAIPSPRRGRVARLCWNVGDLAKVQAPLVELDGDGSARSTERESSLAPGAAGGAGRAQLTSLAPGAAGGEGRAQLTSLSPRAAGGEGRGEGGDAPRRKALAAPAVRAMARELGLAIDEVEGSGPGGRVTKDDLAAVQARRNGHARPLSAAASTPAPTSTPHPGPLPAERGAGEPERIPLRGLRRRMAEHMARAKRTAAHFTFVEQCDATELVRVKERIAAAAAGEGVKVTFLPFVLKAAVAALGKHPHLNATVDEERKELVVHRRHDLGVAAAADEGLVVPVVRDVDRCSILDLAREVERLGAAARAGRVAPEDLGGSTFTVSSLGALGGLFATPVLNHPEVAILGVHRIRPTPVVRDGAVVVRDVMHLSVTCDHRVVDGHSAAAFAYDVIRLLEAPELLFAQLA